MFNRFKLPGWIKTLGPGIITAALILGPGSLTVASKLGSAFKYQLLWVVILATIFMIVFTLMSARIGLNSNKSLIGIIKDKYNTGFSIIIGIGVFLVTASFQTGNSIGVSLAFAELFGTSPQPWIMLFTAGAVIVLFFRSFYKILEKIMIIMTILMLLSFAITLLITRPDPLEVAGGIFPSIPTGSEFLSIALIASSFSVVGAFYQSYLVQEKGWKKKDTRICMRESLTGILLLGLITSMVLLTAGTVLYPKGIEVNSAAEMGRTLEPLFGTFASSVFMIGLFAASFSSLIGNATLGGSVFADALSLGRKLSSLPLRIMVMVIIVTGGVIAFIYSDLQLNLIVFAQGITIVIVPLIGLFIYLIANSVSLSGEFRHNLTMKFLGITGIAVLVFLAINNVYIVFFT